MNRFKIHILYGSQSCSALLLKSVSDDVKFHWAGMSIWHVKFGTMRESKFESMKVWPASLKVCESLESQRRKQMELKLKILHENCSLGIDR